MANESQNHVLEMRNIMVRFPGVLALDDVSFSADAGEVRVLIGENGAGKSTLMKVLIGLYKQNAGDILINGKPVEIRNTRDAQLNGVSMIHQELNPVPEMTIAENIFLGREPTGFGGFVRAREQRARCAELLGSMGIDLRPDRKMRRLSVAEMQMVEIIKAVSFDADIIIMDEPTSAITTREVERLFEIIARLKKQGKTIIYISHKMDEIFRVADSITVLRDGRHIATKPAGEFTQASLVSLMVGRDLNEIFPKTFCEIGEERLRVEHGTVKGKFRDVSFSVRKGEILGIAGLVGAGRTELVEAVFGVRPLDSGDIYINGKSTRIRNEHDAIKNGIALVSEDRKAFGLNLVGSVRENISLAYLDKFTVLKQFLRLGEEKAASRRSIADFGIKTPTDAKAVGTLSGGNQQKVVIAKWMLGNPDIIILDEPTRGIDVGAKAEIHKMMCQLAARGKAIVMISSELPEIMGMSDRVIVLHEGELTGRLDRDEFTQDRIMHYAIGNR